ncbi:TlpA family protein disulfide reductase [Aquiflexum sp. TKW24L]|uniref:TlpA family protein disulfide reductase n=1 Tax=Aquiflexum sp. TKW24L TaxID=2942212 RepID=UPI0020BDA526|nr:TlpA disulfide reductase family protein [Aquiflexum sp. TKW24L]MCL6260072.1 TlpA family protein disulfide reductase [Aquiflexum sp. TKW24L]
MVLCYLTFFWLYLIYPQADSYIEQRAVQNFKVIDFDEFESTINNPSEKLRIFNFWATWCAPCIKEMPYFESVKSQDPDLELFFISMDDGRNPERVTNFISKRKIKAPVYLLDEVNFNKWIGKVDRDWSGAIPATLFIKPDGSRSFHEGEVSEEELKQLIKQQK